METNKFVEKKEMDKLIDMLQNKDDKMAGLEIKFEQKFLSKIVEITKRLKQLEGRLDLISEIKQNEHKKHNKLLISLMDEELTLLLKEYEINIEATSIDINRILNHQKHKYDAFLVGENDLVVLKVCSNIDKLKIARFLEKLPVIKNVFPEFKNFNVYGMVFFKEITGKAQEMGNSNGLILAKLKKNNQKISLNSNDFKPERIG